MSDGTSAVEAFRARYRATEIGPRYRGWVHFAFTSLASLAVVAFALSKVHRPSWAEWAAVPLFFLIANAAEYFGHKSAMHVPRRGLGLVYRRHTREHHHFFTADAMSYASARDFKMVLFPPVMIIFFLGVIATPIALVLFALASRNVAWLFVATAMGYFLTYEWLHFAYHLPPESTVGRSRVIAALRRHHQAHHDLGLMGRYNFNITFPICDALFGTTFRGERRR
ncbi:MAG: sterol desaturase family protein [Polyangiaceae bacterium]